MAKKGTSIAGTKSGVRVVNYAKSDTLRPTLHSPSTTNLSRNLATVNLWTVRNDVVFLKTKDCFAHFSS